MMATEATSNEANNANTFNVTSKVKFYANHGTSVNRIARKEIAVE